MAFDKHFNLLMREVTEEVTNLTEDQDEDRETRYSGSIRASNGNMDLLTSSKEKGSVKKKCEVLMGFIVSSNNQAVSRRYMPQLLVRGDSIVCIYRAHV